MRMHAPWQVLITALLLYALIYVALTAAAALCIWPDWPHVSALLLLASFSVLSLLGPIGLSWTSTAYKWLIPLHLAHQLFAVLIYAGHYMNAGLITEAGTRSHDYLDALYFSLATWSTLGTSDFTAEPNIRFLPPLEALTCILFLPVFAAVFWKMLEDMTPPSQEAYLDKKRARDA